MDKEMIIQILNLFPDEAEVDAEFTFVNEYNTTYSCYIEGINLRETEDKKLSVTLRLLEKKEAA